jgi:hypothetical protein
MRTGGALLFGLLGAVALASCGQLTPGSGQGDCNANDPHECCGAVTQSGDLSCGHDYGPATCGVSGWTCGLGSPAYACGGLCTPGSPLVGNPERDAETDAITSGDDTADDETDGAPADDGGAGDAGADACAGVTPICCSLVTRQGVTCQAYYGGSICGPNGWTCPRGGDPVRACSTICTENPVATTDASPADGADDASAEASPDASAPTDAGDGG